MIERRDGRLVVQGPVTNANVVDVLEAGEPFLTDGNVVFDFAQVTEADSTVLSLMLEWSRRARRRGVEVAFAGLSDSMRSLTDLYGVVELIPRAAS
ncbi:MAG TPA: STAS domain-containing protein [Burkholderiales bacterium]|nr:STAS domain-containing protein [Burkholderiales bacterium]